MLERLRRSGFHVYAPDLLDMAGLPSPRTVITRFRRKNNSLQTSFRQLDLQKPNVGGWSMGGWIVLKLALDHPDVVNRVVVYDSAGLQHQVAGGRQIFHPTNEAELQHLANLLEPNAKPLPSFVLKDALRHIAEGQWVVDRSMDSMEGRKDLLDARLGGLTKPLLIVWGSDDQLLPLSIGQEMHGVYPRSELDILQGCGHLAPKTCPDRAAAVTVDFLKENPPPTGGTYTLSRSR